MDDSFSLTWEDSGTVVQTEEVICGMEETEILPGQTEEFQEGEANAQNGQGNIMYLADDNVLVMQDANSGFAQDFIVAEEEVVSGTWDENCPEEIVIGSEEAVGVSGEQTTIDEDLEIPLPTDQDEYTAARPFPCDFCSRRFRKKTNLMNHMVAHQSDRPHGCNLCGVRYMKKSDLMNHLKVHAYDTENDPLEEDQFEEEEEEDSGDFRKSRNKTTRKRKRLRIKEEYDGYEQDEIGAGSSSMSYYNNDQMREMRSFEYESHDGGGVETSDEIRFPVTDHRKPFVCQHCGVGFAREKALASHARMHAGDSPFECHKCTEMFWDMNTMREHCRLKHEGDTGGFGDDDEDDDYSGEDHRYGTFYCPTCGMSFHRQDNLKRHQRIHVKEEMGETTVDQGHICNVCGDSFPEALDLLAHAEVHARPEHRCMICGEDFEDDQGCAVHVQEKHGHDLPPHTCMLCGRSCKDRRSLLKHSWEHSKDKVFSCNKCTKTFLNKARLKRHLLSHRSKAVTCDVCGEEFPDGRSLMNHRHSHSNVSGRQFPCKECGKTFGSRSSQQIHIRIHTGERPYGCRFCWKAFADGGTLRKHERIHTGEKPYACAVCPRAFNQRVVLREHIRSHHSGPDPKYTHSMTPYCCAVCSDLFTTSQDLILHLIHHCDMNTAMKRQPQIGPRKYKRRRKLKPHELDMLSHRMMPPDDDTPEELEHEQPITRRSANDAPPHYEIDMTTVRRRRIPKRPRREESEEIEFDAEQHEEFVEQPQVVEPYQESPPLEIDESKTRIKKKLKIDGASPPSRPKMIHTQKTRVPLEPGEDGRIRHKTKTTITRTTSSASSGSERIRPRTKNVNYHIFNSDKLPIATFPEDVTAVQNLLKDSETPSGATEDNNFNLLEESTPEVASEQTVECAEEETPPVPVKVFKVHRARATRQSSKINSLRPGRHIIGPGTKVRMVKSGMIVKKKNTELKQEVVDEVVVKQERDDPSPLHELAEISMQHAQQMFKCEMCSAVFTDRAQLLVHVPVHI